jgi:nucleoside-diphosphate-sugar epimerase
MLRRRSWPPWRRPPGSTGVYNVCDDAPLTRLEYVNAFTDAFALPRPRLLPSGLVRCLVPKAAAVLTASQRCTNGALRRATGWRPTYRDAGEGWISTAQVRAGRP